MVPAKGTTKFFNLKSSWRRSKILAASLKHWKGRRGGLPPPPLLRCTAILIHLIMGGLTERPDRFYCNQPTSYGSKSGCGVTMAYLKMIAVSC